MHNSPALKPAVTQEFDYGCAIACIAFMLDITYNDAAMLVGREQAESTRFYVKDVTNFLNSIGKKYKSAHIKLGSLNSVYTEGTIVLIRRSKLYPFGHYLIRHGGLWMDSWINMPYEKDITKARSGFRRRLPGKAMYTISPIPVGDTPTGSLRNRINGGIYPEDKCPVRPLSIS